MSRLLEREAPADRRRAPRPPPSLPGPDPAYSGAERHAMSGEVGVAGMKVRVPGALEPKSAVRISFTPLDCGTAVEAVALVLRRDPDGYAPTFVNLPEASVRRLGELVRQRR